MFSHLVKKKTEHDIQWPQWVNMVGMAIEINRPKTLINFRCIGLLT